MCANRPLRGGAGASKIRVMMRLLSAFTSTLRFGCSTTGLKASTMVLTGSENGDELAPPDEYDDDAARPPLLADLAGGVYGLRVAVSSNSRDGFAQSVLISRPSTRRPWRPSTASLVVSQSKYWM